MNSKDLIDLLTTLQRNRDATIAVFAKIIQGNEKMFVAMDDLITSHLTQRSEVYNSNARKNDLVHVIQAAFVFGYLLRMDQVDGTLLDDVLRKIGQQPTTKELEQLLSGRVTDEEFNKITDYCQRFSGEELNFDDLVKSVTSLGT